MSEVAWRLGVGVTLAWAALPLLVRVARSGARVAPLAYYRALVLALAIATALLFAPTVHDLAGLDRTLALALPAAPWSRATTVAFAAEWVNPWLGSRSAPWSSLSLSALLSGLGVLWSLAFAVGVAHVTWARVALWRRYRSTPQAPPHVLARARWLAAELGVRPPEIGVAPDVPTAFTFGVVSPRIILAESACRAAEGELDFTLRHELVHVARSDTRAAFWIDLAQRCFVGHPSLRALANEIRFAREAAVDEAAAGGKPLEYARFLLELAERMCSSKISAPHLVAMADGTLKRRVETLMTRTSPVRRSWRGPLCLAVSGLVLETLVFLAPRSWGQDADARTGAPDHAVVHGNLSVEQVQDVLFRHPRAVQACYVPLLTWPRPDVVGRLLFEIEEDGHVGSDARAEVPEHPELESCLEDVLRSERFPAPSSGTVTVNLPVTLTPSLDERNARAQAEEGVGRLPREVVQKVVRGSYDRFGACYQTLPEPRLELTATLAFTIGRDGRVLDGEVASKDRREFAACLDRVMRSLVFPAPDGGIVTVTYPIMFAP